MRFLLGLALWATTSASAQQWVDAGMPFNSAGIRQLYSDTATDRLLAVGQITLTTDYAFPVVAGYDESGWSSTSAVEYGGIYTILRYGDTLLLGGYFHQVDGMPIDLVAAWYDSAWHSFGMFQSTGGVMRKLRMVNDTLYGVGSFQTVDGNECNGIAKRVGGHWENVGDLQYPVGNEPIVLDVCAYQDHLVVGGEMSPIGLGVDLVQYDGTQWSNVGGGLAGSIGSVGALEVYQGELYVGGGIYAGAGSPGHGLVRWDGTTWRDVGGSMRDIYGTTQYNASANSFMLHDGKLFVGGSFGYAGDVQASKFAVWDGTRWCSTGDSLSGRVESMAYYHDTLYVTCWDSLHGEPTNYIAKWEGGVLEQTCGTGTGIPEVSNPRSTFTVGPLVNGQRQVFGLPDGRYELALFDALGKAIDVQRVRSTHGRAELACPSLASGLYVVRALGNGFRGTSRFITAH